MEQIRCFNILFFTLFGVASLIFQVEGCNVLISAAKVRTINATGHPDCSVYSMVLERNVCYGCSGVATQWNGLLHSSNDTCISISNETLITCHGNCGQSLEIEAITTITCHAGNVNCTFSTTVYDCNTFSIGEWVTNSTCEDSEYLERYQQCLDCDGIEVDIKLCNESKYIKTHCSETTNIETATVQARGSGSTVPAAVGGSLAGIFIIAAVSALYFCRSTLFGGRKSSVRPDPAELQAPSVKSS